MGEQLRNTFLSLIRLGIGHHADALPPDIEWQDLKAISERQGLEALVLDGIERLPEQQRPPKIFLLEWIGETLQGYEYRYEQYRKAIAELAGFYNSHGYKMMVLKGYACSIDWPKPEHRPCGDIDIWLFGKQEEVDKILEAEKPVQVVHGDQGFKIDKSHHHHTVFYWCDFMVENHYDFVNIHAHKSSKKLEKIFKSLGQDDSHIVELYGEKVYLPSANLHALFLIKHMVSHFAASEISLRQVLDWAFFVKKHANEINWEWLLELLDIYHMLDFYNCINAICVEDLGFDFNYSHNKNPLKERVLNDILEPEFGTAEHKNFFKRQMFRYKRWTGNAWKQDMCYNESRWEYFWTGLLAKLMKPSSL